MRRIGLLVALLSVLLLVGLGLLVARALESVENERAMRHEVLAERVFDEMEEALTEITEREEARPFLQYRFFFVPEDQVVGANPSLSRSPLSHVPEEDWLLGWFQLDPGGGVTTPFLPDDTELATSIGWSDDAELDARVARLTAIASQVPVKPVDRRPVADKGVTPVEEKTVAPASTRPPPTISTAPARTKTPKKPAPEPKKKQDEASLDEIADAGALGGLGTGGDGRTSVGAQGKKASSSSSRDPYGIASLNKGATKRADRQQRVTKSNAENLRSYQFPEDNQALLGNESDLPQVGFEGESGEVVAQVTARRDQWDASAGDGLDLSGALDEGADAVAALDDDAARDANLDGDRADAADLEEFDVEDLDAMAGGEDFADLEELEDERVQEAQAARTAESVDADSVEQRSERYAPERRKRRRLARKESAVPPVFGGSAPAAGAEAPAAEPEPEPESQTAGPADATLAGKNEQEKAHEADGQGRAQVADAVTLQEKVAELATEELGGPEPSTGQRAERAKDQGKAREGWNADPEPDAKPAEVAAKPQIAAKAEGAAKPQVAGPAVPRPVADPAPAVTEAPPPEEPEVSRRAASGANRGLLGEVALAAVPEEPASGEGAEDEEVDVEISPFRGHRVGAQTMVLFRTVRIGDIEYVQGLALLLPQLADWLEEAVLSGSDVKDYLELSWNGVLAKRGPAPDFSFAHTFAEPFTDLAVTSYLRALPEARGSGRAWILQLTAALVIVGLLGLVALWRMVSVVVHFAERRNNFVAAVSHELKTPLTAIRMYAEMLRDGYVLSEDKRGEYYETMAAESERLSRLIQNVLELSRLEKGSSAGGDLVTGDVRPVLEEAVRVLERHAKDRGFRIALEVPENLPAVRYERDGLLQVLINLVDNGIKFSKASDEKVVVVEAIPRGGGVLLQIRDHGPGVPSKQLGNIFQPFYRGERELTRRTKGTGIGLALVKGIVERMGGNVSARNHPDGGFEVRVALAAA